jgi:hypothetical protein
MIRTLLAFAVSPLAVPITFAALGTEIRGTGIFLIYGYVFEMLLGVPIWLIFRHYRISSFANFACWGGLIGLASFLVFGASFGEFGFGEFGWFPFACILSGALAATIFWSIASRGRMRETAH